MWQGEYGVGEIGSEKWIDGPTTAWRFDAPGGPAAPFAHGVLAGVHRPGTIATGSEQRLARIAAAF